MTADPIGQVQARLLAHQDFGRSATISRRVTARYDFAMDILAERLPKVAAILPTLRADRDRWTRRVLRDPVVKTTIENAIVRLERDQVGGVDDLELVVDLAAAGLIDHPDLMPTQAEEGGGLTAGPGGGIWVPRFGPPAGELEARLGRAFRGEFLSHNNASGTVVPADESTAEKVDRAASLLTELLPLVGPDTIDYVVSFGMIDAAGPRGRLLSASGGDGLPGLVALRPDRLDDPWEAAGRLLHEGLHLKLFDIMRCFAMVADPTGGDQMPWRDVRWDIQRVLAAFHVYSHMVLFQRAVLANGERLSARYGAPRRDAAVSVSTGARSGYDGPVPRARHLSRRLSGPLAKYLTSDGRRLVGWLREVIAPLVGESETTAAPASSGGVPAEVARYERAAGLRLRPVPEATCLYAFRPDERTLHCLNLSSWSVFELCDGLGPAELEARYADLVSAKVPAEAASRLLRSGLAGLEASGLIRRAA